MNIRNLTRFTLGIIFLATFLIIIIRQDPRLLIIFGFILAYLFICLLFFSFSYCIVTEATFFIRGDFMFIKEQQIQKRVLISLSDIKSIKMSNMKDHMNTNGETISFKFRYGDERLFIYGLEKLQCIEISLSNGSIVRFVTNKYSPNQIDKIIKSLPVVLDRL